MRDEFIADWALRIESKEFGPGPVGINRDPSALHSEFADTARLGTALRRSGISEGLLKQTLVDHFALKNGSRIKLCRVLRFHPEEVKNILSSIKRRSPTHCGFALDTFFWRRRRVRPRS